MCMFSCTCHCQLRVGSAPPCPGALAEFLRKSSSIRTIMNPNRTCEPDDTRCWLTFLSSVGLTSRAVSCKKHKWGCVFYFIFKILLGERRLPLSVRRVGSPSAGIYRLNTLSCHLKTPISSHCSGLSLCVIKDRERRNIHTMLHCVHQSVI